MRTTPVRFVNRVGYQLAGLLDTPSAGPVRAHALFAHCFTCGKDLKPFANMSASLTEDGFGVLRFDFSGLGKSAGDFAESSLSTNETDLLDAAAFLENNFGAPKILIGHSMGGAAAILAAEHLSTVTAVATIAAPADAAHLGRQLGRARDTAHDKGSAEVSIGGQRFTLTREFFDDLERTSLRAALAGLDKSVLILHSPRDETVSVDNAARLFAAAKHPKSFVSLGEADHLLLDKRDARYAGAVIGAWAGRYV